MKLWYDFLKDVMPWVKGCPEPVAEHAVLRAAQSFFGKTAMWTEWLDPISTDVEEMLYDIPLPATREIVRLESARLDGRTIEVLPEASLPENWQENPNTVTPTIFSNDLKTLTLLPPPKEIVDLLIYAALKPSEAAEGVEDQFFALHVETIAMGAVARLMQQPNQPYTNPAQGLDMEGKFLSKINTLNVRRWRGFSNARPRRALTNF